MNPPQRPPDARLAALFEEHGRRVYAYAARHTDPHTANDVVADAFLIAWRRIDDVPEHALPWLLVTARNVIANATRGERRRDRLASAMTRVADLAHAPSAESSAVDRSHLLDALGTLTDTDREALLLTAWDGLTAYDAAAVAGCSPRAFEVRLSRARARFDRALKVADGAPTTPSSGRKALA